MRDVKRVFCPQCCSLHEFRIEDTERTGEINGKEYTYLWQEAYCCHCGSSVLVPGLSSDNTDRLVEAMRNAGGEL